jgi:hypothetical protein
MSVLTVCPCCSRLMLRHIERDRIYWFCRSCWQEMPDFSLVSQADFLKS